MLEKFYFASVRKVVSAVGTLFNDVYVQRRTGMGDSGSVVKTIKVPLLYGQKSAWYVITTEKTQRREGGKLNVKIPLPRMTFEMTGMTYDANRKIITIAKDTNQRLTPSIDGIKSQYAPVPYDFGFNLYIEAKNQDDGYQIIEQIVPYFTPQFSLTVKYMQELGLEYDVPIIINTVTPDANMSEDPLEERLFSWTLSFTAKGYIFPPVKDAKIIKTVLANIYGDVEHGKLEETIRTYVDPSDLIPTGTIDPSDRDSIIEGAHSVIE